MEDKYKKSHETLKCEYTGKIYYGDLSIKICLLTI